jgi:hypothetical protein
MIHSFRIRRAISSGSSGASSNSASMMAGSLMLLVR